MFEVRSVYKMLIDQPWKTIEKINIHDLMFWTLTLGFVFAGWDTHFGYFKNRVRSTS